MNLSFLSRRAPEVGVPDAGPARALRADAHCRRRCRPPQIARLSAIGCVLCGLLAGSVHAQQVTVTPTVTSNGALFDYSYSVFNGAPSEIGVISFQTLDNVQAVTSPAAPPGFLTSFDDGNGFISFGQDTDPDTSQSFAPDSTVAPFTFTSRFAPGQVAFEAFDVDGNRYVGTTLAPAAAPEPNALLVFGTGVLGLSLIAARRRRPSEGLRLQARSYSQKEKS